MSNHFATLQTMVNSTLTAWWSWLFTSGVRMAFIVIAAWVLLRVIRALTNRLGTTLQGLTLSPERQKRAQTLSHIVRAVATTILFVIATMLLLAEVGVNLAPLLAAAGIGGLAIGFGAQNLVRDIITGFFILLEDHVRVGDVVKVGDKGGLVESLSLRALTLRDFDGSLHVVPHSTITTITNMTKDFSYYLMDVGVAYREDIDQVMTVLKEVGADLRRDPEFAADILDELEVVGVDDLAASQVTIKVRIKTVPIKQWRVGRELRRRIKKAFDVRGIEIPFPHLTLYFGEPKQGVAPPAHVALDSFDHSRHGELQRSSAQEDTVS